MNNILVPIGTSPDSSQTLQYAIDFASHFGAKIFVMDVFSVTSAVGSLANVEEKVAKSSKEHLKEVIDKVDTKGIDIKIATYNGDIVDGVNSINKELGIDLIIISPKSNDIQEELYLGNTSGRIIKQTDVPALIVPKGSQFSPIKKILTAFGSGILKRRSILNPLITIKNKFKSEVSLLLVKRPGYSEADLKVNTALMDLSKQLTITENATTYLGVMEHFQKEHPDVLCVFRRKRGFFKKLWEKNTIRKSEFYVPIPVLVLSVKKD
ncbi:Nucleotide-binding universal stress protein, UspA family [Flagellimonas taeanensis]|jgi:nucleotide-binding universal stress UspA family protein|uniref:Nucleotide-binding universal stress protein, UspA family n=1 Tax=Flagellimonas taeanensis TaxID=1005926 RepID=A0A1M6Q218_9FLAO|nr:universal stress protein [Allomuricauda taeanensis]MEE1961493.1 universal stress protein [Allomuricauda taeanensis]SFB68815.1 Nucleotide-binding universal stress protein, UspA family [Allomuricauda taeanensis]SHK14171.1 Nucleotide-binding universal stress protein, UspA family [Allomuricauda taeanensis]